MLKPDELGCAISVEGKMKMMATQPDRPALEVITTAALLAGELARLLLLVPPGCRKGQVRISTKHRGEAPELGMQSWHADMRKAGLTPMAACQSHIASIHPPDPKLRACVPWSNTTCTEHSLLAQARQCHMSFVILTSEYS